MAPAGLTVVIIREDLAGHELPFTPLIMNYQTMIEKDSMYNTPPCYAIYICKLVLEWIKNEIGGLEKMKERNEGKAALLYDFLDSSKLFKGTVVKGGSLPYEHPLCHRQRGAGRQIRQGVGGRGLYQLKGHRSVGGMRAPSTTPCPWRACKDSSIL